VLCYWPVLVLPSGEYICIAHILAHFFGSVGYIMHVSGQGWWIFTAI